MEEKTHPQAQEAAVPAESVKPSLRAATAKPPLPSLKQIYDARKRAQASPQVMFQKCSRAFHAGKKAKTLDLARVSVVYDDALADEFFFDGYDGKSWEDAVKRLIAGKTPAAKTPDKAAQQESMGRKILSEVERQSIAAQALKAAPLQCIDCGAQVADPEKSGHVCPEAEYIA